MINDFPISEAEAKAIALDINKNVPHSEATVVGRGGYLFREGREAG